MGWQWMETKRRKAPKNPMDEGNGCFKGGGRDSRDGSDVKQSLEPLLERLRCYDALRLNLEKHGGQLSDLRKITLVLNDKFRMQGSYRDYEVALVDRPALHAALSDIGNYDLHMDVRQLDNRMPVYFLCRIRKDYWSEYSLIVEDSYRSPGYPLTDERFVKLMDFGHEKYYLRLSQFRQSVAAMLPNLRPVPRKDGHVSEWEVDAVLHNVGRHVFQAAWHDDQRPGMFVATCFNLPRLRQAIELLYLSLTGELCELRGATDERMLSFFEGVYPQPAIHAFLKMLSGLDGGGMNEVPQRAIKLYARLSTAFGRFVGFQVTWGARRLPVPLYKLLFANIFRLELVAEALRGNDDLATAAIHLDEEAGGVIDEILAGMSTRQKAISTGLWPVVGV